MCESVIRCFLFRKSVCPYENPVHIFACYSELYLKCGMYSITCLVTVMSIYFATPMDCSPQTLLSLGFPRQGYWSGFPFASPVDLPDPQIEPTSPTLASRFLPPSPYHSVARLWPSLGDPMNCSMLGLPIHHQLPEFTHTHVHQVGDAIQPSHPLSSPFPPSPNPSQHQSLFQ